MINQVTLVGRLVRDPELKYTAEGIPVASITLAAESSFRNKDGEIAVDFIQCTIWNKAAENTAQYCNKGTMLGVTGRIHTRNYENKEGKRVYVTEVVAETVKFISSKKNRPEAKQEAERVGVEGSE